MRVWFFVGLLWLIATPGQVRAQGTWGSSSKTAITKSHDCSSPASIPVAVTTSFAVGDLDVKLLLVHRFRGELQADLVSPTGTRVRLISSDLSVVSDNYSLILDVSAGAGINMPPNDGDHPNTAPPYAYAAQPDGSLADFAGEPAQGTWLLEVCDAAPSGRTGHFEQVELVFSPLAAPLTAVKTVATPDANYLPGATVIYSLTVDNAGTDVATDIVLQDILPESLRFQSASATGFSGTSLSLALPPANTDCTGGACAVTLSGASLAAGGNGELSIVATLK